MPRPPEMTTRAAVSSGRSLSVISAPTKLDRRHLVAAHSTVSTLAEPPSPVAAKAVVRTVATTFLSEVWTVSSALPA